MLHEGDDCIKIDDFIRLGIFVLGFRENTLKILEEIKDLHYFIKKLKRELDFEMIDLHKAVIENFKGFFVRFIFFFVVSCTIIDVLNRSGKITDCFSFFVVISVFIVKNIRSVGSNFTMKN